MKRPKSGPACRVRDSRVASNDYAKSLRNPSVGDRLGAMAGQEVFGHGVHGRPLLVLDLFLLDPVALVLIVDQLHRFVDFLEQVDAVAVTQVLEADLSKMAFAIFERSKRVWLRCTRMPRSTCAIARRPYASEMASSKPSSTP